MNTEHRTSAYNITHLTWVVRCVHNTPSLLRWDILRANHILPEGTRAAEVRFKKSGNYVEAACENGLRIRSSPHRLVLSSPASNDDEGVDARLRSVLDRYLAAAPELVCKAIDIKTVAEVFGLDKVNKLSWACEAGSAGHDKLSALRGVHLRFADLQQSGSTKEPLNSRQHSGSSIAGVKRSIVSADFSHALDTQHCPRANIGNDVAHKSRDDMKLFKRMIIQIASSAAQQLPNPVSWRAALLLKAQSLDEFAELDARAEEMRLDKPDPSCKATGRALLEKLCDIYPADYCVFPSDGQKIMISASRGKGNSFLIVLKPEGKISCFLEAKGRSKHKIYSSAQGLPDDFFREALHPLYS